MLCHCLFCLPACFPVLTELGFVDFFSVCQELGGWFRIGSEMKQESGKSLQ